ncbi:uncharacterized protein (TIGR03083 family) [Kribbella amoyensis]|uniref:Uncharacterized protein (TIGR03083 family) n=1 Tax=Kribbella amoyensis TaxID=996641 RepID=A0A561B0S9_9ACTN|nr:maleylpyruvate isomerase family mycothiol-dependent enzyme [Kribbella amoyensis]TWD72463.1 uncharacterized protein (TIGR03083 family) [Kribbella amoyensis]
MGELDELIRTERLALVEFLTTLEPGEWATPSLCGEWTVQEVAAHLAWAPVLPLAETAGALVRSGFRMNKASAELAKRWALRGTDPIIEQLRSNADRNPKPPGVPAPAALVDAVVHQIDIRHPLGKPRAIPVAAFRDVADFSLSLRWPLNLSVGGSARKRVAGVRLVAIGYDWSHGDGPEAHLAAEGALRLLNGRPVDPDELNGPGAEVLAGRLDRGRSHP